MLTPGRCQQTPTGSVLPAEPTRYPKNRARERLHTEALRLRRSKAAHGLWAECGPIKLPGKPGEVGVEVRAPPGPSSGLTPHLQEASPPACTLGGLG